MRRLGWQTRLRVEGQALAVASYIGITESRSEVDHVDKRRDLNGGLCMLRPLWGTRYKIALQAAGPAMRWVAPIEALPKDQPVDLWSTLHMGFCLLPGTPSSTLPRRPVPGSVRLWAAADADETPVPYTLDGLLVSPVDAGFTEPLVGASLPIHRVSRNSSSASASEISGVIEWQAEFEEYDL